MPPPAVHQVEKVDWVPLIFVSGESGFLAFFFGTALGDFGSRVGSCAGFVYFLLPSLFV